MKLRLAVVALLLASKSLQAGPVFDAFLRADKVYTWHYGFPRDRFGLRKACGLKWITPGSTVAGSVFEVKQTNEHPLAARIEVTKIIDHNTLFDAKHGLLIHGASTEGLKEGQEYPLPTRGRLVGYCRGLVVHNHERKTYRVPEIILEIVYSSDPV